MMKLFSVLLAGMMAFLVACGGSSADEETNEVLAEKALDKSAQIQLISNDTADSDKEESDSDSAQTVAKSSALRIAGNPGTKILNQYSKTLADGETMNVLVEQIAGVDTTDTIKDDVIRTTVKILLLDGNVRTSVTESFRSPWASANVWDENGEYTVTGTVVESINECNISSGVLKTVWKKEINADGKTVVYAKSESREIDSVIQTATRKGTIRKIFLNYSRDVAGNRTTSCRYFDIYPDGKKVLVYVYEVLPDLYVDADGIKWVKTLKANGYILSRWYDEGMFRFSIWKSYDAKGVLQSHSAEKKKRAQVTYSEVSIVSFKASGEISKIRHITYTYYWTGNTVTIIQNVDGEIQPVSVAESNYGYTIIAYGMLYRVEFYPGSIIRISYKDRNTGADIVADVKVSADGTYSVTYNTADAPSLDLKNVFGN